MKNKYGTLIFKGIFLIILGMSGCSNYRTVVGRTLNKTGNLEIRSPQKIKRTGEALTVKVNVDNQPNIPFYEHHANVDKTKTLFVPLIIWNYWDHISIFNLRENQIDGKANDYLKASIEQGLQKAGFEVVDNSPQIEINLTINDIKSSAFYERSGYSYFGLIIFGYFENNGKGPYRSSVDISIETKYNGKNYKNRIIGNSAMANGDFEESDYKEFERTKTTLEFATQNVVTQIIDILPDKI